MEELEKIKELSPQERIEILKKLKEEREREIKKIQETLAAANEEVVQEEEKEKKHDDAQVLEKVAKKHAELQKEDEEVLEKKVAEEASKRQVSSEEGGPSYKVPGAIKSLYEKVYTLYSDVNSIRQGGRSLGVLEEMRSMIGEAQVISEELNKTRQSIQDREYHLTQNAADKLDATKNMIDKILNLYVADATSERRGAP